MEAAAEGKWRRPREVAQQDTSLRGARCGERAAKCAKGYVHPRAGSATLSVMRVLGIDCGTEFTGYGVVEEAKDCLVCLSKGAIRLSTREALELRLKKVFEGLCAQIEEFQPEVVAIEDVFYSVNAKSALKLGHVRGVAMMAAAYHGLSVEAYAPLSVKSAVAGYGRAEKHQVQEMVTRLLKLDAIPEPADAADALAIAICHIHTAATLERQKLKR